jgi:L-ribulose-5-phosphate 4-epimerase
VRDHRDGRRVRRRDPGRPFALIGGEEIGRGVVATLTGHRSSAVLMRSHGVFTIGGTGRDAVKAAVMC